MLCEVEHLTGRRYAPSTGLQMNLSTNNESKVVQLKNLLIVRPPFQSIKQHEQHVDELRCSNHVPESSYRLPP